MIADSLDNLGKYEHLIPSIKEITTYLAQNDISSLTGGKYEIAGDNVFILIQEYYTNAGPDKLWESHKKYTDIQLVLDGQEYMGYSPVEFLKVHTPYSEENDIVFYENDSKEQSHIMTHKNHFCVFFPKDAHKPGLHITEVYRVKKAVIKVKINV